MVSCPSLIVTDYTDNANNNINNIIIYYQSIIFLTLSLVIVKVKQKCKLEEVRSVQMKTRIDRNFIHMLVNSSPYEIKTAVVSKCSPFRVNYHLRP